MTLEDVGVENEGLGRVGRRGTGSDVLRAAEQSLRAPVGFGSSRVGSGWAGQQCVSQGVGGQGAASGAGRLVH